MKSKWAKSFAAVLVTGLLFWYFYQTIEFGEVAQAFRMVRLPWMGLAVLAYCMTYPLRAFRIYYLTRTQEGCGFLQVQKICCRHQFYGRILPFKAGELSLVYLLKKEGISLGAGSTVLLLIRLFDVTMILLSFFFCNFFVRTRVFPAGLLIAALVLVCLVFVGVLFLARHTGFVQKLPKKLRPVAGKICNVLSASVATPKDLIVLGLVSLGLWALVYLSMHSVVLAFAQEVSFCETVVASFLASVAAFLPVNGIGGFGVTETGWTLGFTLLGLDRTMALSTGVASNTMSFCVICLFGLLSYIPATRRNNNV